MNETTTPPGAQPHKVPEEIPPEIRDEILRLHGQAYGSRQIAKRVGKSRKIVCRVLDQAGVRRPPPASAQSKLQPFAEAIVPRVQQGLTTTRILREIRALGYQGGRTILAKRVATLKAQITLAPTRPVKRRFETRAGEEMQIDWSPFTVPIGGRPTKVHALSCLLCYSRKLYLRFFRDERQPTLLEGLTDAFAYFDGCTLRVVLDNMATAVLGRVGAERQPLWHPRFLECARHYGFTPIACAVRDPDRKGKDEKTFRLVWDDLLKGAEFESWDDLARRCRIWLDETPGVGNLRVHGTTRRVPNEAWQLEERDLLIRLPAERFAAYEQGVRVVDRDATLSIRGTRYTVPAALACRSVAVRLYAEHFEILDAHGNIAFSRRYVADSDKGKLIIDPTHYANLPRRPRGAAGGERLDESFVQRFPTLQPFVEGLKLRFKTLTPIHLRALLRLADTYGEEAFVAAASSAQEYRRFDALAVRRILEHEHPTAAQDDPAAPLGGIGPVLLGEVEPASLDGYGHLDGDPPSSSSDGGSQEGGDGA
jgi:transposase